MQYHYFHTYKIKLIFSNLDENSVIIFLTVYRKFMKPSDLVNILIKK
jgi:hypothetical protein